MEIPGGLRFSADDIVPTTGPGVENEGGSGDESKDAADDDAGADAE